MKKYQSSFLSFQNIVFCSLLLLTCELLQGQSPKLIETSLQNFDQDLDLALTKNSSLLPFIQELQKRETALAAQSQTGHPPEIRPQPDLKKALIERELRIRPEEQGNLLRLIETHTQSERNNPASFSGQAIDTERKWDLSQTPTKQTGWTRQQWTAVIWSSLILGIAASQSPYKVIVRLP